MTYDEKIERLFARFPSYQKVGGRAYKMGVDSMMAFDELLGHPHRMYPVIHIAGTNGKGSVCSMLAAALSGCGRRVGLYTSPHLVDFRERMKIVSENGAEMIPKEAVETFLDRYDGFMDRESPSFFEITTAMAFDWFASEKVDLAVIETGLGGRLDSTNVVTPELSVITNIGLEHCMYLGNTLPEIAFEKGGIIKPGVPVVIGEDNPETRPVFERLAAERGSRIVFAGDYISVVENALLWTELLPEMDLAGVYQRQNLATVLAALDVLQDSPRAAEFSFSSGRIAAAARLTDFRGRWERLAESPDVICDIGHNAHGLRQVFSQIEAVAPGYDHIYIVFGVVSDKDVEAVGPLMTKPSDKVTYLLTQPSTQRAMPVGELASRLAPYGIHGSLSATVPEAVAAARSLAGPSDLIFIGGSNFTVSDAVSCIA